MKNKFSSYGFWTALAGATVVLLNALGSAFGFAVEEKLVTDIIMAIAGVLVVFGVVSMPKGESKDDDQQENIDDKQEDDVEQKEDENK